MAMRRPRATTRTASARRGLLVLAILTCGCRQAGKVPGAGSNDSVENQNILTKLQGYMLCLDHSARVFQVADVYTKRFAEAPPTPELDVPLQTTGDPEKCIDALKEAKPQPPSLPALEAAGEAYGKALNAVFLLTTTGHDYYDRASRTYAPAKGVALHGKLLAAFHEFDVAQGALFDEVYRLNRSVHQDQLARREHKNGRTFAVIADDMMLRAEDLVRFAATPWDHLDKLDVVAFTTSLGRFESAIEEMSAYGLANTTEAEGVMKGFRQVTSTAQDYLTTAKQLLIRARDHVAYTDAEKIMLAASNERSVVGTPAAMILAYNNLVDSYSPVEPR